LGTRAIHNQAALDARRLRNRFQRDFDLADRRDQHLGLAVVQDVGQLVCGQKRIDAGAVKPRSLAGTAGLEIAGIVFHEHRVVVEPLEALPAQQMGESIGAGVVFGIGHRFAARRHDEGGAVRVQLSVVASVHGVS
jgi:hypothetical protein